VNPFDIKHLPQLKETFGKQWVPASGRPKKPRDRTTPRLQAAARLLRNHGWKVQEPELSSQDNLSKSPTDRRYTCHVCNSQEMVRAKFDEESG
jgi:hypothetical protein